MPPRSSPTVRQARLGAELRKLREAAGMAAREAGAFLGGNQAQISHIEAGRWGVSADRVRRLAARYSASDEKLVEALSAMAEERGRGWWEEYRGMLAPGFRDLAELEHHATYLRCVNVINVPGILQTEEYIRAIHHSYRPALPAENIDARVEFRLRRRNVLERDVPLPFKVIVHEAALRRHKGTFFESSSFPLGICAESAALSAAVTDGIRDFTAIAVVGGDPKSDGQGEPVTPCGGCRQRIFDVMGGFERNVPVFCADLALSHVQRFTIRDLLPFAFSASDLPTM